MMEFANSERKGSANSQLKCQSEELAFRKQCIILVGSSNEINNFVRSSLAVFWNQKISNMNQKDS